MRHLLRSYQSTAALAGGPSYSGYLKSLAPSGYWRLNEAAGSSSFVDSSGNGLTASATGTYLSGAPAIVPNASDQASLGCIGLGHAALSSSGSLDITSLTPISFVGTFTIDGNATKFLFSKTDSGNASGYWLLTYSGLIEFGIKTNSLNNYTWTFPLPNTSGVYHIVVSWGGVLATKPSVWINGAAQTVAVALSLGSPNNLTTSAVFRIGGRSDGLHWNGFIQEAALWIGTALSSAVAGNLWSYHQNANYSGAVPFILDTDAASTDIGDLAAIAYCILMHRIGRINLLGIMVTCGDDYTAPAVRAILDYYGLTSIPVGAYQGTDCHVGGGSGTPARNIRDRDRPSDTRSNYSDPATFYNNILTTQANGSVVVAMIGFLNSISAFLNASGANTTLWNAKVKYFVPTAGQWPNSSSTASPAGNYLNTGTGEWNIGGSDASSVGTAEAQAATDIISKSTVPHYWNGVEICGEVGNAPALASFIASSIPTNWSTANPIRYGWGTGSRTAWDILGTICAVNLALYGSNNIYFSTNQITTPSVNTTAATAGQNSSSAGSSNNYYITPKLGSLSLAQWRTTMALVGDVSIPAVS